ncbi:ac82 [Malacosoma neustria nucleopolyhedrovirus]|uniref:ac82 n=1 Tax=Malacosoma neustria nuclear polyhedrosis virus TaxID=38012 RepID=UPI000E35FAF3|nr:ac82 [Malacosoma neustria nucleopolyhedrovirus]AUF81591.1 ac82 [Malacosoma neustria nucleopolyhedrovirus]
MPTSELHNNFIASNISSVSSNDVTKTNNSDLFLATFGNNENVLNRAAAATAAIDESTTDTDNGYDDDDDDNEDKLSDEPVAAKRQKLDHPE